MRRRRRVADGRRGQDEHGFAAIAGRDPLQPAQHLRDVRAEDTAVAVALVDDDEAKPLPERRPALMAGKECVVEHVRIGEHHVGM